MTIPFQQTFPFFVKPPIINSALALPHAGVVHQSWENMTIQNAYDQWSETYDTDRNRTRDLDQMVTKRIWGDSRFSSILELGCGTGKNTALYTQIGGWVHAVDFAKGMIEQARRKIQASNVQFMTADISKSWPCGDQSYDLITCNLVLEHIKELDWIFSEVYRSLQENGRFFVCELHPFRQYQGKQATFSKGDRLIQIPAYVHHLSDYLQAARHNQLALLDLEEWWHKKDQNKTPRLVSFVFKRKIPTHR